MASAQSSPTPNHFDQVKSFNGQKYKGMSVGESHHWNYNNAVWDETKVTPDLWKIEFRATKSRQKSAPVGSGAPIGTEYHWTIAADQIVKKIDADHYETFMQGMKFKTGYKKPFWKGFSYTYPGQLTKNQQKIKFLESITQRLKEEEDNEVVTQVNEKIQ